jgi:hypothetical protein
MVHDIEHEARALSRFDFIALYVQRATSTKRGRELTDGYQLLRRAGRWSYRNTSLHEPELLTSWTTAHAIYDIIRRTPLNYYVRQAEDLREDIHAHAQKEATYQIDREGPAYTAAELHRVNDDDYFTHEVLPEIERMQVGDIQRFGGGAAATFTVTRIT